MDHSKRARKRYFNVSSHKQGVTKSLNVRNILMVIIIMKVMSRETTFPGLNF